MDLVGGGILDDVFLLGMGLEDEVPVLVHDALDDVGLGGAGAAIGEDRVGEGDVHERHFAGAKVGGREAAEVEQLAAFVILAGHAGEAGVLGKVDDVVEAGLHAEAHGRGVLGFDQRRRGRGSGLRTGYPFARGPTRPGCPPPRRS